MAASDGAEGQRVGPADRRRPRPEPAQRPPRRPGPHRLQVRLRRGPVRRLHGAGRRPGRPLLPGPGRGRRGQGDHDDRGAGRRLGQAAPAPAGVPRARRHAVRLLHARHDHGRRRGCWRRIPIPASPRSSRRCRATSAGAGPILGSSPRSAARPPSRREEPDERPSRNWTCEFELEPERYELRSSDLCARLRRRPPRLPPRPGRRAARALPRVRGLGAGIGAGPRAAVRADRLLGRSRPGCTSPRTAR